MSNMEEESEKQKVQTLQTSDRFRLTNNAEDRRTTTFILHVHMLKSSGQWTCSRFFQARIRGCLEEEESATARKPES